MCTCPCRKPRAQRLFEQADAAFGGRIDILVNNADVFFYTPLPDVKPEVFRRVFDINVLGMILASQAAARRFPTEGGTIINVNSVVAVTGFAGSVVYSASKGAIDAATRVLASELAPRQVRVNAINPGLVVTEGTKTAGMADGEFLEMWKSMSAFKRPGTPDDITPIVLFLASPESGWLTGETLYTTGASDRALGASLPAARGDEAWNETRSDPSGTAVNVLRTLEGADCGRDEAW